MNTADIVCQQIARDFTTEELRKTWVIGTSRFEVTNVAIWADNADLRYDIFVEGALLNSSLAPEGTEKIVVVGNLADVEQASLQVSGEGYAIFSVD